MAVAVAMMVISMTIVAVVAGISVVPIVPVVAVMAIRVGWPNDDGWWCHANRRSIDRDRRSVDRDRRQERRRKMNSERNPGASAGRADQSNSCYG